MNATKSYAGLMVTLLDRDSGKENKVMLYPAVRVELMEMPLEPADAPAVLRVFLPLDNMGSDVMGWREVESGASHTPTPEPPQ